MPFPAKTNTDAIIASASEIIRTGGLVSLSMRTLAGRLGVRASSLYRHFPDRSSIEETLALRAAQQLFYLMEQSALGLTGERALVAASRAYLDYATAEPAFYDLMMQSVMVTQASESTREVWDFFLRSVSDTTKMGDDVAGAAALWSFLHGFTVIVRAGRLGETSSRLAFSRATNALLRGLSVAEAEAASSAS